MTLQKDKDSACDSGRAAQSETKADVQIHLDAAALLDANIAKMHHQQTVVQGIRLWSFAFTGFLLGSSYLAKEGVLYAATSLVVGELILFVILLRAIDWHRSLWRYRDRARVLEALLLGEINVGETLRQYRQATDPSRWQLLRGAFSPRQLLTATSDFVEVYLMILLALAFAASRVFT